MLIDKNEYKFPYILKHYLECYAMQMLLKDDKNECIVIN